MSGTLRAAIVIGNGGYEEGRLTNPTRDAEAIDGRLKSLGFDTVFARDLSRDGFFATMDEFRDRFVEADVSLLFYAGHGIQHDSKNYLVPVEARIRRAGDVVRFGIEVSEILKLFEEVADTSIAFLDCCRNNPYLDQILANTKAHARDLLPVRPGLAKVEVSHGTLVAYATGPDSTADDGDGDHSPFTRALLSMLGRPNESIVDMMIDVTNEVAKLTNNRQHPWYEGNLRKKIVFNVQPVTPAPAGTMGQEAGEAAWLAISASNSISVFDGFVRKYPASPYSAFAQARIDQIKTTNRIQQALTSAGLSSGTQVNVVGIRPYDRANVSSPQPARSRKSAGLGLGKMVHPAFFEGLVAMSLFSVAKIVTMQGDGVGTAFFVKGSDIFGPGDDRVYALTASHVVGVFDFAVGPSEVLLSLEGMNNRGITTEPLPVSEIVWQSERMDRGGCDATVLGFGSDLPDFVRPIPVAPGLPELDPASPLSFATRPQVVSISYPYGGGIRFGTIDNYLLDYDRPTVDDDGQPVDSAVRLHHTAASEPGSSGCPILDEHLEVIGVHLGSSDHVPRLNGLDGHYAANIGVWIQSIIRAARR